MFFVSAFFYIERQDFRGNEDAWCHGDMYIFFVLAALFLIDGALRCPISATFFFFRKPGP